MQFFYSKIGEACNRESYVVVETRIALTGQLECWAREVFAFVLWSYDQEVGAIGEGAIELIENGEKSLLVY